MWSGDWERELRTFVAAVEPTRAQKAAASRSHRYLREILRTGQMERRIIADYLSGSYARGTAIRPLDDVDIVFLIDPAHWKTGWFRSLPPPAEVLETFARAIRRRYDHSSVRTQRRSVRLRMYHLDIDVVPAVAADGEGVVIKVGDAADDTWIESAPKRHSEIAARVNQKRRGLLKPLVKLLKHWNGQLPEAASIKSFAIETMATRLFDAVEIGSLADGVFAFLDFVAYLAGQPTSRHWTGTYGMQFGWWSAHVPDTGGSGSNLLARVDSERRRQFVAQAIRGRDALLAVRGAATGEAAWNAAIRTLRIA